MNPQQHNANGGLLVMDRDSPNRPVEHDCIETLLTAREVATTLKVSYGWVRDHATRKEPRLPCVRVGDLLRFRPADIRKFIIEHCQ